MATTAAAEIPETLSSTETAILMERMVSEFTMEEFKNSNGVGDLDHLHKPIEHLEEPDHNHVEGQREGESFFQSPSLAAEKTSSVYEYVVEEVKLQKDGQSEAVEKIESETELLKDHNEGVGGGGTTDAEEQNQEEAEDKLNLSAVIEEETPMVSQEDSLQPKETEGKSMDAEGQNFTVIQDEELVESQAVEMEAEVASFEPLEQVTEDTETIEEPKTLINDKTETIREIAIAEEDPTIEEGHGLIQEADEEKETVGVKETQCEDDSKADKSTEVVLEEHALIEKVNQIGDGDKEITDSKTEEANAALDVEVGVSGGELGGALEDKQKDELEEVNDQQGKVEETIHDDQSLLKVIEEQEPLSKETTEACTLQKSEKEIEVAENVSIVDVTQDDGESLTNTKEDLKVAEEEVENHEIEVTEIIGSVSTEGEVKLDSEEVKGSALEKASIVNEDAEEQNQEETEDKLNLSAVTKEETAIVSQEDSLQPKETEDKSIDANAISEDGGEEQGHPSLQEAEQLTVAVEDAKPERSNDDEENETVEAKETTYKDDLETEESTEVVVAEHASMEKENEVNQFGDGDNKPITALDAKGDVSGAEQGASLEDIPKEELSSAAELQISNEDKVEETNTAYKEQTEVNSSVETAEPSVPSDAAEVELVESSSSVVVAESEVAEAVEEEVESNSYLREEKETPKVGDSADETVLHASEACEVPESGVKCLEEASYIQAEVKGNTQDEIEEAKSGTQENYSETIEAVSSETEVPEIHIKSEDAEGKDKIEEPEKQPASIGADSICDDISNEGVSDEQGNAESCGEVKEQVIEEVGHVQEIHEESASIPETEDPATIVESIIEKDVTVESEETENLELSSAAAAIREVCLDKEEPQMPVDFEVEEKKPGDEVEALESPVQECNTYENEPIPNEIIPQEGQSASEQVQDVEMHNAGEVNELIQDGNSTEQNVDEYELVDESQVEGGDVKDIHETLAQHEERDCCIVSSEDNEAAVNGTVEIEETITVQEKDASVEVTGQIPTENEAVTSATQEKESEITEAVPTENEVNIKSEEAEEDEDKIEEPEKQPESTDAANRSICDIISNEGVNGEKGNVETLIEERDADLPLVDSTEANDAEKETEADNLDSKETPIGGGESDMMEIERSKMQMQDSSSNPQTEDASEATKEVIMEEDASYDKIGNEDIEGENLGAEAVEVLGEQPATEEREDGETTSASNFPSVELGDQTDIVEPTLATEQIKDSATIVENITEEAVTVESEEAKKQELSSAAVKEEVCSEKEEPQQLEANEGAQDIQCEVGKLKDSGDEEIELIQNVITTQEGQEKDASVLFKEDVQEETSTTIQETVEQSENVCLVEPHEVNGHTETGNEAVATRTQGKESEITEDLSSEDVDDEHKIEEPERQPKSTDDSICDHISDEGVNDEQASVDHETSEEVKEQVVEKQSISKENDELGDTEEIHQTSDEHVTERSCEIEVQVIKEEIATEEEISVADVKEETPIEEVHIGQGEVDESGNVKPEREENEITKAEEEEEREEHVSSGDKTSGSDFPSVELGDQIHRTEPMLVTEQIEDCATVVENITEEAVTVESEETEKHELSSAADTEEVCLEKEKPQQFEANEGIPDIQCEVGELKASEDEEIELTQNVITTQEVNDEQASAETGEEVEEQVVEHVTERSCEIEKDGERGIDEGDTKLEGGEDKPVYEANKGSDSEAISGQFAEAVDSNEQEESESESLSVKLHETVEKDEVSNDLEIENSNIEAISVADVKQEIPIEEVQIVQGEVEEPEEHVSSGETTSGSDFPSVESGDQIDRTEPALAKEKTEDYTTIVEDITEEAVMVESEETEKHELSSAAGTGEVCLEKEEPQQFEASEGTKDIQCEVRELNESKDGENELIQNVITTTEGQDGSEQVPDVEKQSISEATEVVQDGIRTEQQVDDEAAKDDEDTKRNVEGDEAIIVQENDATVLFKEDVEEETSTTIQETVVESEKECLVEPSEVNGYTEAEAVATGTQEKDLSSETEVPEIHIESEDVDDENKLEEPKKQAKSTDDSICDHISNEGVNDEQASAETTEAVEEQVFEEVVEKENICEENEINQKLDGIEKVDERESLKLDDGSVTEEIDHSSAEHVTERTCEIETQVIKEEISTEEEISVADVNKETPIEEVHIVQGEVDGSGNVKPERDEEAEKDEITKGDAETEETIILQEKDATEHDYVEEVVREIDVTKEDITESEGSAIKNLNIESSEGQQEIVTETDKSFISTEEVQDEHRKSDKTLEGDDAKPIYETSVQQLTSDKEEDFEEQGERDSGSQEATSETESSITMLEETVVTEDEEISCSVGVADEAVKELISEIPSSEAQPDNKSKDTEVSSPVTFETIKEEIQETETKESILEAEDSENGNLKIQEEVIDEAEKQHEIVNEKIEPFQDGISHAEVDNGHEEVESEGVRLESGTADETNEEKGGFNETEEIIEEEEQITCSPREMKSEVMAEIEPKETILGSEDSDIKNSNFEEISAADVSKSENVEVVKEEETPIEEVHIVDDEANLICETSSQHLDVSEEIRSVSVEENDESKEAATASESSESQTAKEAGDQRSAEMVTSIERETESSGNSTETGIASGVTFETRELISEVKPEDGKEVPSSDSDIKNSSLEEVPTVDVKQSENAIEGSEQEISSVEEKGTVSGENIEKEDTRECIREGDDETEEAATKSESSTAELHKEEDMSSILHNEDEEEHVKEEIAEEAHTDKSVTPLEEETVVTEDEEISCSVEVADEAVKELISEIPSSEAQPDNESKDTEVSSHVTFETIKEEIQETETKESILEAEDSENGNLKIREEVIDEAEKQHEIVNEKIEPFQDGISHAEVDNEHEVDESEGIRLESGRADEANEEKGGFTEAEEIIEEEEQIICSPREMKSEVMAEIELKTTIPGSEDSEIKNSNFEEISAVDVSKSENVAVIKEEETLIEEVHIVDDEANLICETSSQHLTVSEDIQSVSVEGNDETKEAATTSESLESQTAKEAGDQSSAEMVTSIEREIESSGNSTETGITSGFTFETRELISVVKPEDGKEELSSDSDIKNSSLEEVTTVDVKQSENAIEESVQEISSVEEKGTVSGENIEKEDTSECIREGDDETEETTTKSESSTSELHKEEDMSSILQNKDAEEHFKEETAEEAHTDKSVTPLEEETESPGIASSVTLETIALTSEVNHEFVDSEAKSLNPEEATILDVTEADEKEIASEEEKGTVSGVCKEAEDKSVCITEGGDEYETKEAEISSTVTIETSEAEPEAEKEEADSEPENSGLKKLNLEEVTAVDDVKLSSVEAEGPVSGEYKEAEEDKSECIREGDDEIKETASVTLEAREIIISEAENEAENKPSSESAKSEINSSLNLEEVTAVDAKQSEDVIDANKEVHEPADMIKEAIQETEVEGEKPCEKVTEASEATEGVRFTEEKEKYENEATKQFIEEDVYAAKENYETITEERESSTAFTSTVQSEDIESSKEVAEEADTSSDKSLGFEVVDEAEAKLSTENGSELTESTSKEDGLQDCASKDAVISDGGPQIVFEDRKITPEVKSEVQSREILTGPEYVEGETKPAPEYTDVHPKKVEDNHDEAETLTTGVVAVERNIDTSYGMIGAEEKESKSPAIDLSQSDLLHKARDQNPKVAPPPLTEERDMVVSTLELHNEETDAHEAKTDEDTDEAEVMVESSKDIDHMKTPKKHTNILSGVSSKVKHSISKVKKAITGKSSNSKTKASKMNDALPAS